MNNRQEKEKKVWDRSAGGYDSFIKNMFDNTYKSVLDILWADVNPNHSVLEIGTGTGIVSFSICSKVSSIIATDISTEMISIATQKKNDFNINNIDFQVLDAYNLTFPDRTFDVVIACNLLHLLYEPEKPIIEVKRVMKDDGIFIAPTFCTGENIKSWIITTLAGIFTGFKVVNKLSINKLKSILSNNGFIIEKALIINGKFPLAYILMKKQ